MLRHVLRVRPFGPCPGGPVPPPGVQAARPEAPEALLLNKQLKKIHQPHVPSVPKKKCNKMGSEKPLFLLFFDCFIVMELGYVQWFVV